MTCANIDTKSTGSQFKYNDTELYNQTDSKGKVDISTITVSDTLENSQLNALNPNDTSEGELLQAFCKDVARVVESYEVRLFFEFFRPFFQHFGFRGPWLFHCTKTMKMALPDTLKPLQLV